jgi:recombinational DNA repair protein (RecF pathway)
MVLAHATSVRHSKSKLRPHIAFGTMLSITLLRSKARWKITEARVEDFILPKSDAYKSFAQILLTIKSLIHGEEKNESLFGALYELHSFFVKNAESKDIESAECLTMIKILHSLGYGEPKGDIISDDADFNITTFEKITSNKRALVSGINKALKETGL